MAAMIFIGLITQPVIVGLVNGLKTAEGIGNVAAYLSLLFGCLLVAMLAIKVPAIATGLFLGQPSLSGSDMFTPIKKAAHTYNKAGAAAGQITAATTMEGGRNKDGSISWSGSLKNLAAMKMKQPMTNGYHGAMQEQQGILKRNRDNKKDLAAARNGTADSNHVAPQAPLKNPQNKNR